MTKIEEYLFFDVIRLGKEATGATIWSDYCKRANEDTAIGQVYASLDRLERKGFVTSRIESAVTNDGKTRKVRYFEPTERGIKALQNSRDKWIAFSEGVKLAW